MKNKSEKSVSAKAMTDKQKAKIVEKKTVKKEKKQIKDSVESSVKVLTSKKNAGLTVDVYDVQGKVAETITLPKEIFDAKINPTLMAQAVRVYLANQRAGSASTKTRGEVTGSTRKIYRQKGTGRARHGGIRAPIFVHGGIAMGPKPRDFSLSLPKKMKRMALFSALSAKRKDGAIKIIDGLSDIQPKTKEMVQILSNLAIESKKKKILLVIAENKDNIIRSARNIDGTSYSVANQLHAYQILNTKTILFMKEAVAVLEKTFLEKK